MHNQLLEKFNQIKSLDEMNANLQQTEEKCQNIVDQHKKKESEFDVIIQDQKSQLEVHCKQQQQSFDQIARQEKKLIEKQQQLSNTQQEMMQQQNKMDEQTYRLEKHEG